MYEFKIICGKYTIFDQQNQAIWSVLQVLNTLPTAEYTFYSSVHRTFTKRDDLLDHKANLNKFKSIKVVQSLLCDHKAN